MSPNLDSSFPWLVNTLWILNCSSVGTRGEESAYQCRRHKTIKFDPWVGKIPRKRKWQSTPIFLPGKSHGHSLAPTPTYKGRGPPHQVSWGGNMTYYYYNVHKYSKKTNQLLPSSPSSFIFLDPGHPPRILHSVIESFPGASGCVCKTFSRQSGFGAGCSTDQECHFLQH